MSSGHVAVIDIGKTNAKLALVRPSDLVEVDVVTRPNIVVPGPPYPHFDVEGHWEFILDGLSRFHREHGLKAITITTHGAAGALIAKDGSLAAPILDYEHTGPDDCAGAYDAIRPPFRETGSPSLSMGLNLGAQLHWQFEVDSHLRDHVAQVVTYPQFWAHRLTGAYATDVTSLGCHTDLWNPHKGQFSSLPGTLGIAEKIAPPRKPGDVLGTLTPDVARRTGLPKETQVHCGIHDSNASLLPHLVARKPPFSVVSTGTWVIAMAIGGKPVALDSARDTLVNVNAFGDKVPSARFMGGREHDLVLAGSSSVEATEADIIEVLTHRMMLLPAVVRGTGPFAGMHAQWQGDEPPQDTGQRSAAVGIYLALVTAHCLRLIGHDGPIIVEGPFAWSKPYLTMLGPASASPVIPTPSVTGTSQGAALLAAAGAAQEHHTLEPHFSDEELTELCATYAAEWNARVSEARP